MTDSGQELLSAALRYIEHSLGESISQEQCARAACCSLSGLQKTFRRVFHISVEEYIRRRRLSCAAHELKDGAQVLDTALKYGYGSAEAFTRAFFRLWGMTPTEYRKNWRFSELYPRLDFPRDFIVKGEHFMTHRFDISELYDYIRSRSGTYVISFDMVHMMRINDDYGHKAGDGAIVECLRRIDKHCGEDMAAFRIGGDEFVLVTGIADKERAKELAEKILSYNGETVTCEGSTFPVSMRAGIVLLGDECKHYDRLFAKLVQGSRAADPNVPEFME